MSRWTFAGLFIFSAGLALAQLDSNTVTVTASRNSNPEPDQVVFGVYVDSGLTTTLGDVLAALQGSGITLANFSSVSTSPVVLNSFGSSAVVPQPRIEWAFNLTVPLTTTKNTVAAFTQLQQSIAQSKSGLTLSFQIQGTRVSAQARQSQPCVAADLIADARAHAQKTAASAGLTVFSIVSMSGSTSACSATVTFGQATSKSVTITASRPISVQPDQVVFGVTVSSSRSIGLDDVLAALQGSGITGTNLSSVYTQTLYLNGSQAPQQSLQWTFTLPVFFGAMSDTVASLTNLQKTIAQQKNGLELNFGPQGTRVSPQAQQAHQCSTAALIADAQAQAQKLADAAGLILGPVLAISEASPTPAAILSPQSTPVFISGDFSIIRSFLPPPVIPQIPPSTCSLVVKFALFGG